MVAFRKLFPVLAIAAFFLGAANTASAQMTCVANAGVPPIVRSEGLTELTGDVVIQCTVGQNVPPAFLANFQIFLNTNITSRLAGGLSEALLMIDEPNVARQDGGPSTPFCVSPANANNSDGGATSGVLGPACNPVVAGGQYQQGTYTVFRAIKSAQGENSLVWPGIPVTPPGSTSGTVRTFRITNVRANASQIGTSSTLIPNQITMFISISASQSLPLSGPQQTVAFVQQGLLFDVRNCDNSAGVGSNANFVQCVAQNRSLFGSSTETGGGQFGVRFREGFQTSFKKRIEPATGAGANQTFSLPGQVFNTESGFVRTTDTVLNSTQLVGEATQGTRLAARFNNVPAGTRIFVQAALASTGLSASLITTDSVGAGGSTIVSPVAGTATLTCDVGTAGSVSAAEISITNGTGVAVWEVTQSNPSILEEFFFRVGVAYAPNVSNNLPALGQSTVTGNFAPFYAASNTDAGRMSGSLPIPRFIDNPINSNDFRIDQCVTNLLFPFVTNQAGFDTGLAISNTSRDPFANPNDRLQAGRCTLNYYGTTTGGGAAPAAQTTNANVEAGSQMLAVLSTGGNLGIAGTPGFQGYIIAQCGFQYAHGFAFITDGPIGSARVAEGYLALVMDAAISTRGSNSEVLGH